MGEFDRDKLEALVGLIEKLARPSAAKKQTAQAYVG
jgi:hypothetical protein